MNQPNFQTDWKKRLEELEAEVEASANGTYNTHSQQSNFSEETKFAEPSPMDSNKFSNKASAIASQVRNWFNQLPIIGKIIVVVVGIGISFSLLKTIFQLVTSLLTLAIIAGLGYAGYQYFIGSKNKS